MSPTAGSGRSAAAWPGTRSTPSLCSRRYGACRTGRVIRDMVLATVSIDQKNQRETIAA